MPNLQEYNKNFCPMPVADLLDGKHHFLIPSFQRGFRWEEKQVVDLLEDIKQFVADDNPKSDSYFLQPIVVKACKYNGVDSYEVLDGQQRLTTLLLILKEMLNGYMTPKDIEKYSPLLYDITYKNRPQLNFDDPNAADNIDSYYLNEAQYTIKKWCEQVEDFTDIIRCLFYPSAKRQVKIIWYAIEEKSADLLSINIFNRLNKGKISLTSSELIKALFIMDYDLRAQGDPLPAEQLSMEWNEMERKFQNENFWYFISNGTHDTQTRIDILFDFVTGRRSKDDDYSRYKDSDYSYREFQKLYDFCHGSNHCQQELSACWVNDNIDDMEKAWKKVRKTFDRLVAWYEDNLYYHYVGYLIAVGSTPLDIYDHLETEKKNRKDSEKKRGKCYEWTVDDTMVSLRKLMMEKFKERSQFLEKDDIDELEYGSEYIHRVLLLFNVECCRKSKNLRFPFDKYKKEKWDVEHIDSQNDATLEKYDERMQWLKNVKFVLDMEKNTNKRAEELSNECQTLIKEFDVLKQVKKETYNAFYMDINKFYSAENGEKESDVDLTTKKKDYLSNLTLLDSATNREYKDAPFAYKRYCIVEKDKKGERFIPLCTRNVFLKYFTDSNKDSSWLDTMRWNSSDREGYMKNIHEALDPIFDSVIVKEKDA